MDSFIEFTFTQKTTNKFSDFTEICGKKVNEISIKTPIPIYQGDKVIGAILKMEFIDDDIIKASGVIWSRKAQFSIYENPIKSYSFDSLHLDL